MAVPIIHPGEHLAQELEELGMSAAELSRKLDVPTNRITGILNMLDNRSTIVAYYNYCIA